MTLYFSMRQMKGFALDLETRVLNDLDEKAHDLVELFIGNPQWVSWATTNEQDGCSG
jgi:hypothetical protein